MLSADLLHPYQKRVVEKAMTASCLGLLMDMGLGKTVTALTIISKLKGKTLIIGPKAVVKNVWQQEAAKWKHTSQLNFALMVGTPAERLKALQSKSDVYLINVENVPWLFEQKNLPNWTTLVVDESSRFKNPSSKRWKSLKSVLKSFTNRLILTGTPTPKSYLDLWCQVGILDLGQRLGKSMTSYKEKFFVPDSKDRRTGIVWSWKLREGAKKEIDALLADICISLRKEDYLTMPERQDITHAIAWDKRGKEVYNTMRKDAVAEVDGDTLTAVSAGVLTGKLLQITSGEIYNEDGGITEVHTEKMDYMVDMVDEDTPTIVFYNFKHSLTRLKAAFPKAVVMDPNDPTMIKRWNDGKINMLLCHPKSAGIGLNLQCNVSDTAQVVWFDLPWSSEDYLQANARLFRQGQTKPVVIHHLCMEKSIDNQVMDVLQLKISIQDALMAALKL
jgi:SNF2 family DNA or RNA helicase